MGGERIIPPNMRLEDWIVVMLAGITLLVTIWGLMLGIMAVILGFGAWWGYNGMIEAAREAASKAATKAATEVSMEEIKAHAKAEAAQVAAEVGRRTVLENKDKWLTEAILGIELAEAQSEAPDGASDNAQAVSPPYPGEGNDNDKANTPNSNNAGENNPPAPNVTPR